MSDAIVGVICFFAGCWAVLLVFGPLFEFILGGVALYKEEEYHNRKKAQLIARYAQNIVLDAQLAELGVEIDEE